jgi:2-oxoglutarate ferredoxin oxidoreductase subunit beta
MHHPAFPEPLGVFRCVDRPVYEDLLIGQVRDSVGRHGEGRLEDLFGGEDVWEVN